MVGFLPRRSPDRDLSLVVSSVGVSATGDFIAFIALALLAKDLTGSGLGVAAIALCLWGPSVLLAGPVGRIADRVESVRLVVVMSLVQTAAAAALALTPDFALVLVLTAALGTANAISQPAEFALVPAVAGEDRLAVANGYVETARYLGLIVGPLAGGLLVAAGGTGAAMLADAASFLFVAVAVGAVTVRRRVEPAASGLDGEQARAGLGHVRRDPLLALALGTTTGGVLLMSISIPADPFFAEDDLGAGATGYAALATAWGLGMVVGSLVVARRVGMRLLVTGILLGIVVQGLGKPIGAVSMSLPVAIAGYLLGGLGHGTRNVLVRTLIHHRTPDRLRGRVFATYNAMRNGAELAALGAGGALVAAISARPTLVIAGLGQAVIGAVALAAAGQRRGRPPSTVEVPS